MVEQILNAIPAPDVYRVDAVHNDQGSTYRVMRCAPVASFDNPEHASFLVELLAKEAHHG